MMPSGYLFNLRQHIQAFSDQRGWEVAIGVPYDFLDPADLVYALRHNMTKFLKAGTQRIHDLGAMVAQTFARAG